MARLSICGKCFCLCLSLCPCVPVSLCLCWEPPPPPPTNGKFCQTWEDFPHMLSHAIYGNACLGAEIVGCETRRHRQAVHDPQCCPQTGVMYGKTFHMGVSMARPVSELCLSPYASARLPVSLSPCVPLAVSLCRPHSKQGACRCLPVQVCLPVSLSPCLPVSLSPCVPVAVSLCPCRCLPVQVCIRLQTTGPKS